MKENISSTGRSLILTILKIFITVAACAAVIIGLLRINSPEGHRGIIAGSFILAALITPLLYIAVIAPLLKASRRSAGAEETLQEYRERFIDTDRVGVIGAWSWDLKTNEMVCSEEYYRIFGISNDIPPTYHIFEGLVHPDDIDYVKSCLKETLEKEKVCNIDFRIIRPDGKERNIHATGETIRDADGNPVRFLGTVQDVTEFKQVERSFRESEAANRAILEAFPDMIFLLKEDGTHLDFYSPASEMLFADVNNIKNKNVREILPEETADLYLENIRKVLESGVRQQFEYQLEFGENDVRFYEARMVPLGKDRVITVAREVTEAKRAEEVARAEHSRFMMTIGSINALIYAADINTHELLYMNDYGKEIWGDRIGEPCWSVLQSNQDGPCEFCTNSKITDADGRPSKPCVWEFRNTVNNRWYECRDQAIFWPDGRLARIEIATDITDRKLSESTLKKSEAKYRMMIEAIKDPVYIASSDDKIQYMNKAMLKRVGFDGAGEKCYKALHGLDERCPWCDSEVTVSAGHSEKNIISPRDNRSFNVSSSKITNEDGSFSKISVYRDLTEFRALQDQLQQAQKMEGIGTLAGGIAHDFNNILSPIMLHSEMVMEDLAPDDPLQLNIREINKAAARARDLVKQILTFARKRSEEQTLLRSGIIVKEAIKFLRSTIPTTIEIKYINRAGRDTVLADPTQLNQIVMNLCTNAAYAMKEKGGVLEVVLANEVISSEKANEYVSLKPGEYLKLIVRDSGTGIPPNVIDRIFEPYFTTKGVGEGTGLGLAIIHGIIQNYGGDIYVESRIGEGAAFHVYLPLIDEEIMVNAEYATDSPGGSERILLVDDEEAGVRAMQKILNKLGYDVTGLTGSRDALEVFRKDPGSFDLIITDMTMPEITGKELSGEVKKIRPDMPVILCTGFSDQIDEEEAEAIGINAFLMKPIGRNKIARIIRDILDKK